MIGDSGRITAASAGTPQFSGVPMTFGLIETIEFGDGGSDNITTGADNDIVLGGHNDGTDGSTVEFINAGAGHNIVMGDDGQIDYALRRLTLSDIDLIESSVDHRSWRYRQHHHAGWQRHRHRRSLWRHDRRRRRRRTS